MAKTKGLPTEAGIPLFLLLNLGDPWRNRTTDTRIFKEHVSHKANIHAVCSGKLRYALQIELSQNLFFWLLYCDR